MFFKTIQVLNPSGKGVRIVTRPTVTFFSTVVAVVLIALVFGTSFRVVGVGKTGIVTQFGQIVGERQSGAFFKLPWQGLTIMNVQTQKEQQNASAATKDLQTVKTTLALNYHLTPATASKVFREIGPDYKIRIIDPVLQEAVKSTTSQYNADELIGQRDQVSVAMLLHLKNALEPRGITIDGVSIVNFNFSIAFDNAIEQKQVAQQNAIKAQSELQSAQLKAQAQDVQAKTLTPEYLELQAIEKWNGVLPTTTAGAGNIFNIPVTK
jgi:regulator of protease activity HflC (stomatin/prohibitin superfamily)